MSSLLYKQAVEQDMVAGILADAYQFNEDDLQPRRTERINLSLIHIYCTGSGLSKYICFDRLSTASWVACCPKANRAGSPGIRRERQKMTIETPIRTNTPCKSLFSI